MSERAVRFEKEGDWAAWAYRSMNDRNRSRVDEVQRHAPGLSRGHAIRLVFRQRHIAALEDHPAKKEN